MSEDEAQHFSGKIAQKAIITMGDTILVAKGIGDTVWEFPGGRLHVGEDPREGVLREIQEEFGISPGDLKPLHVGRSLHTKSNTWRVLIMWQGFVPEGTPLVVKKDEVQEHKWISRDELASLPMFDDCRTAADYFLKQ